MRSEKGKNIPTWSTLTPLPQLTERDYFQIPVDDLTNRNISAVKHVIELREQIRVTLPTLSGTGFDPEAGETVVFNLPTNSGKTTLFYDLIGQYATDNKNVVIVCSPFIKLVNKDFEAISQRIPDTLHYNNRAPLHTYKKLTTRRQFESFRVHVMTVNCLLQNPGESSEEVNEDKREYLEQLLGYVHRNNKKVILFIDELHESVHNFGVQYLPNLTRWRGVIAKVFTASATFTPASYAIVQHLSRLTGDRVVIFEAHRNRRPANPATLNIHFTHEPYYAGRLDGLYCVHQILDDWKRQNQKGPVNILVGHRALVDSLTDKETRSSLYQKLPSGFNITRGSDTGTPFLSGANNIGTTFKTGVNIVEADNLLIVILPYLDSSTPVKEGNYGIFSDGVPAILQALGRQRNGGQCHVIMSRPKIIIEGTVLQKSDGDTFSFSAAQSYRTQNDQLDDVMDTYERRTRLIRDEIVFLQGDTSAAATISSYYPSLQDFLLSENNVTGSLSSGLGLSSYLLWAACNNQIEGVKLKEVKHWYVPERELKLSNKWEQNWRNLLALYPELETEVHSKNLHDAFTTSFEHIFYRDREFKITVIVNNTRKTQGVAMKDPQTMKLLLGTIFSRRYGSKYPEVKKGAKEIGFLRFYLRHLVAENTETVPYNIQSAITDLKLWAQEFNSFLAQYCQTSRVKKRRLVHPSVAKAWTGKSYNNFVSIISYLSHNDPLFTMGVFRWRENTSVTEQFFTALLTTYGHVERLKQKRENMYRLP